MSDVNSKYILDKLSQINIDTTCVVDDAYISQREAKLPLYKDNNGKKRTDKEKRLDIDCEWADHLVLSSGKDFILPVVDPAYYFRIVKQPENVVWCVDNKVVHDDTFFLYEGKYTQYLSNYRKGHLHYFAFWKFIKRPIVPFEKGFKPELLVLSVLPAGIVLERMCDPRKMTRKPDEKGLRKYIIKVI